MKLPDTLAFKPVVRVLSNLLMKQHIQTESLFKEKKITVILLNSVDHSQKS